MTVLARVCALALVWGVGASVASAAEFSPPPKGNACYQGIQQYAADSGAMRWGIVQINSTIERDGSLRFGVFGNLAGRVKETQPGALEPIIGNKALLKKIYEWSFSERHGMWMLVLPGVGETYNVQVFVAGEENGKPKCFSIYRDGALSELSADKVPYGIFD
ncbi:MAG: hypothetical protein DI585_01230 [Pseudomonas fluorescens]|nr:MAG: hypothetical protein DI585_01230 [Pseudomonas fluorescens]